jgi:uncharacterized membrane protein YfcA
VAPGQARQLDAADRRRVLAAVRSGERLDDARLRPHAVSMATNMLASSRRWEWMHRHRRWVVAFLVVGAALGLVGYLAADGGSLRLFNVVVSLLLLVIFLALDPVFTRLRVNADLAIRRNSDGAAESAM